METFSQNIWNKSKLLVKAGIITVIMLLLQIPVYCVQSLISEREARQKEAIAEVSSKWAGRQTIIGPVLVVPFWQLENTGSTAPTKTKHLAYFLPDSLNMTAAVSPQEKYRGIYKVMLYSSLVNMTGAFTNLQPQKLGIASEDFLWNEAYVRLSASDNKGLNDEVKLTVNGTPLSVSPLDDNDPRAQTLYAPLPLPSAEAASNLRFTAQLGINGSEQLLFTPVGKTTTVSLSSAWPHPSFTGNSLPQVSVVKESGFTATWKSLSHKQAFPQQWKDDALKLTSASLNTNVAAAAFGVDLFVPVNDYQKVLRSVKYSLLCLALTFAAFFLIETTSKKSAHPFHYGLIGLALVLFYTLLLSISEYTGFNAAYVVASLATIALIAWFANGILASGRLSVLVATILLLLYGYVFTLLQLQDYSLLLGSIGLFLTLAVIMHFAKNITASPSPSRLERGAADA